MALPTGTVTFLFTDLEGSTRLWEEHPDAMRDALARHDEILRVAVEAHDGQVVKTTGDGLHAAFATASDAVRAAADAQRALAAEDWSLPVPLRVRMGVHTGEAELRDGDYFGTAVNRAARLMSTANGGQVLVSAATVALVRDTLADGLDVVDLGEHRLRDLGRPEHVFQVAGPGLDRDFAGIRSLDAYPGNLRPEPTTFVGRERDLEAIADLVQRAPVVTLTGVGGAGKTRLALHAAAAVLPYRPHGAWFVELAPVSTEDGVPEVVASTLGIFRQPGRTTAESVLDYLRAKDLLLVLDNCEHVIRPASELVAGIIDAAPGVTVVATSREGLGVPGEHLWPVGSLGIPRDDADAEHAAGVEAVRLFTDRATAVRPDFALTAANVGAVVEICRRLDGIPLALELAAARIGALAPADVAARLDERFRLLTGGKRVVVERHQTLRSAVEWSYDLLEPRAQRVFERLSVFAGGFTLAAAEAVAADAEIADVDVLDILDDLVTKSMVVADAHDAGTRYRLLETLRQYGRERLEGAGDVDRVRRRHAEYFAAVMDDLDGHWMGPDEVRWFRVLDDEFENLRAAVTWSVDAGATDLAMRLTAPIDVLTNLDPGWVSGSLPEMALAVPGASTDPRYPRVCTGAAMWLMYIGEADRARALAEAGWRAARGTGPGGFATAIARTVIAMSTGSAAAALEWLGRAEALEDAIDGGSRVLLAAYRALVRRRWGDEPVAATLPFAEAGVDEARRLGWASGMAFAHYACASVIGDTDPSRAIGHLEEAIRLSEPNPTMVIPVARNTWMRLAAQQGDAVRSMGLFRAVLTAHVDTGVRYLVGFVMANATWAFATLDQPRVAAILGGVVDAEVAAPGLRSGADHDRFVAALAHARDALGVEEFERLHARGASMTYDEAVEFALAEADRVGEESRA